MSLISRRTDNIKINASYKIFLTSYSFVFINKAIHFISRRWKRWLTTTPSFRNNVSSITVFPVKIRKYTYYRSPHGHKRSREQFEVRIYKVSISLIISTGGFQKADCQILIQKIGGVLYRVLNQFIIHLIPHVSV